MTRRTWQTVLTVTITVLATGFSPAETRTPRASVSLPVVRTIDVIASSSDPLLTRGIAVVASGGPAASFEYGWSESSTSAPTTPLERCSRAASSQRQCRVSLAETTPDQDWNLLVRAVDPAGQPGMWSYTRLTTPTKPVVVALGDSIGSAHHRDENESSPVCTDPEYGYPRYVFDALQAGLPAQWQQPEATGYRNMAHSGFSTDEVLHGGEDGCRAQWPSPVTQAGDFLSANKHSWNRVLITGGIDNTNWTDVLFDVVVANQLSTTFPLSLLLGPYTRERCEASISRWSGFDPSTALGIQVGARTIVALLARADPDAHATWLGYHNIAGTGRTIGVGGQAFPETCRTPVARALDWLSLQVARGVAGLRVSQPSADTVLGGHDELLQPFFGSLGLLDPTGHYGWPHPNSLGAAALARLVN